MKSEIFSIPYTLKGYKLSYGTITNVTAILIKITDSEGNFGWGEANPLQPFTFEGPRDVERTLLNDLIPVVIGKESGDPVQVDALLDAIHPGAHLLAKGAISMALVDLAGKKLGVPAADFLGGAIRQSLKVSYPLSNGTPDDDIAVIDAQMKRGYVDFMLKMGSSPIENEIQRVLTLERRYGDRVVFKADPNAGWTRDEAVEFLAGVKNSRLAFVEQPIAKDDIDGLAILTQGTSLPVSADESLTSLERAREIVSKGAANVFSIKSSKNGGPFRAKSLSELARKHGINCYFNSMLEGGITQAASLHHAVSTTNILDIGHAFRSTLRLDGDVTDFSSYVCDGVVHLPIKPGLGIEVDEWLVRQNSTSSHSLLDE